MKSGKLKSKTKKRSKYSRRWLLRYIKVTYARFLKMRGEPRQIALGLALGIMIGMTPFMGFHTVSALFLATFWKWNKIAAVAGVFITNPFTAPFIYPITYVVGNGILGLSSISNTEKALSVETVAHLIKTSPLIMVDLLAGGIIVGLPLSIVGYWGARAAIENYRKKLKPKLNKKPANKPNRGKNENKVTPKVSL